MQIETKTLVYNIYNKVYNDCFNFTVVSDITIFMLKGDVKLLTNFTDAVVMVTLQMSGSRVVQTRKTVMGRGLM